MKKIFENTKICKIDQNLNFNKIIFFILLLLTISCNQKNYSKMSVKELKLEGIKYEKKLYNRKGSHRDIRELSKIRIIYKMKMENKKLKNYDISTIENKSINNMTKEELSLYINFLMEKLYKEGNLSDKEMQNMNWAMICFNSYNK